MGRRLLNKEFVPGLFHSANGLTAIAQRKVSVGKDLKLVKLPSVKWNC